MASRSRYFGIGCDLAEWLEWMTVSANISTVLSSVPASFDTVDREGLQMKQGDFIAFFKYFFQHCVICPFSNSDVLEDASIEPRAVATLALAVRRSDRSV